MKQTASQASGLVSSRSGLTRWQVASLTAVRQRRDAALDAQVVCVGVFLLTPTKKAYLRYGPTARVASLPRSSVTDLRRDAGTTRTLRLT